MKHVLIFGLVCFVKFNKCFPHDFPVISKYAKVAVWSNNNTDPSSARKINSGNLWNHRLDTTVLASKAKNPSVVHQYPVYQKPDSKIDKKTEHVPGIGEVIIASAQDRFEARPHFAYKSKTSSTYLPPSAPKPKDTPAPYYLPPSTGAPVSPMAASNEDLYNSPYSSYNPPDFKPDDSESNDYPPNNHNYGDFGPTMAAIKNASPKGKEHGKASDSDVSLGPSIVPHGNNYPHEDDEDNHNHDHQSNFEPHHYHHFFQEETLPADPVAIHNHKEGPPHPPKGIDDVYYPPDFPQDQIPHSNGGGHDDHTVKDDIIPSSDLMVPEDMMPPDDTDEGKSNDSGGDNIQEPLHPPFPPYLYDQHHYDHHVYEEIPHTTMTPAKEDKRVSSTHYSYYYLGRKLWYIPLYFSIYFIIYVTILIVKSIARHKVKLKYKWYEHDSRKEARSLNLNHIKEEEVTEVHRIVDSGLKNATFKYNSVLAMK